MDTPTSTWNFHLHELRRYGEEYGSLDVPFKWRDPSSDFNNAFAKWVHAQPGLYMLRRLSVQQARRPPANRSSHVQIGLEYRDRAAGPLRADWSSRRAARLPTGLRMYRRSACLSVSLL